MHRERKREIKRERELRRGTESVGWGVKKKKKKKKKKKNGKKKMEQMIAAKERKNERTVERTVLRLGDG